MTTPSIPLLGVQNLSVSLGPYDILHDLSFSCGPGVLGVCGINGSGKSTLLRTLSGILKPVEGSISVLGHDLEKEPAQSRKQLGYVPEHAELHPSLSCREICQLVASLRGVEWTEFEDFLQAFGLEGKADVRLSSLSAGQQRKVTMMAALCGEPSLLLLDEPLKALDHASLLVLNEAIEDWRSKQRLVILASHQFDYLTEVCDHFLLLKAGRLLWFGQTEALQGMRRGSEEGLEALLTRLSIEGSVALPSSITTKEEFVESA